MNVPLLLSDRQRLTIGQKAARYFLNYFLLRRGSPNTLTTLARNCQSNLSQGTVILLTFDCVLFSGFLTNPMVKSWSYASQNLVKVKVTYCHRLVKC